MGARSSGVLLHSRMMIDSRNVLYISKSQKEKFKNLSP
jgi:hypothetical protein